MCAGGGVIKRRAEGKNIPNCSVNGPRKRDIQMKDDSEEYYGHASRG